MNLPRFLPLAAIPTLLALFASSCAKSNVGSSGVAASAEAPPSVAVTRVTTKTLANKLVLTAEFKPYQEIDVMAKVAGYIKQINVDIGDRVKTGQVLATLEIPEMGDDLTRALAAVDRSQADVRRAQDELNRVKSAHDIAELSYQRLNAVSQKRPGLVAQQEIDDAHGKDLVAEAQIAAANSALQAAQEQVRVNQAEVAKVKTMMDYTKVTAPFDGVVTKRFADTGSMIQAGTASQTQAMPVVRLSQVQRLRLILPVPEKQTPSVHIGQAVDVIVPSLHRTFPGRVSRFENKLSLETRSMNTEVDVENPQLTLMPGMYAEVDLVMSQKNNALSVPINAIDMEQGSTDSGRVTVVTPGNRIEVRQVKLGIETANDAQIESGLNEGDMVVIGSRSGLQAGQEVRPKETALTQSQS
jgi:RND family efflux transporter MFP subunit